VSWAAVVVLHDSEPELRALLASIDAHLAAAPRLVVVDSGSRDGGADVARAYGADVVERPDNPGFGAATNAGLELVDEEIAVLLNPDVELLDPGIERLVERARGGGLHAPRLLNPDGSVQRSAHPLPGTLGSLVPAALPSPLTPVRAEPHRARRPRSVGWAIAACLAGRTETLRSLGPFDSAVHLFAEDMELCLRARARGIRTVLHPDIALRHAGGHSTLREGEPYALLARRRREAIERALGVRARRVDDVAQALTFVTRTIGHTMTGDAGRPRAQLRALLRSWAPRAGAGGAAP
jgi:GT2 family glycosyltransferase